MRFLLDTSTLSHIVREPLGPAATRYRACEAEVLASVIVVAEAKFGLRKNKRFRLAARLEQLLERLQTAPFEPPADDHYAALRVQLEQAGTPIGANDMLIAAHALALDATLVTANEREFRRVPGLRVENWAAQVRR